MRGFNLEDMDDRLKKYVRFPQYTNIIEKVYGAGNLDSEDYIEMEALVSLAQQEFLEKAEKWWHDHLVGFLKEGLTEGVINEFKQFMKEQ